MGLPDGLDYCKLKKFTLPEAYPTLCLSQVVDSLTGSKGFSSLNAAQAFNKVPIEESSQDVIAFIRMYGLFESNYELFGLRNTEQCTAD